MSSNNYTVLLFIALAVASVNTVRAASFDCAKATTKTERLICSDPGLSRADEVMAAAYKKARTAAGARLTPKEQDDLKQDQLNWLKFRVGECLGNPMSFGEPAHRGAP